MFPEDILTDIERGKAYFSGLHQEYTQDLYRGCIDCKPLKYDCLKRIMRSLDFKVELDEYDDVAKELWRQMIVIIGDYVVAIPPTVSAGPDQSKTVGQTGTATAVATPGSSAIVGYSWTKLSGGTIVLTNANTATVGFSNFGAGTFVLQVTVTDANGLTASDTFTLSASAAVLTGYWWVSVDPVTPLTESEILTKTPFTFSDGGSMTIPFTGLTYTVPNIAYPVSQANRVKYVNTANSFDTGDLGTPDDLLGAVQVTGGFKQQNGNYVINGNRTLRFT